MKVYAVLQERTGAIDGYYANGDLEDCKARWDERFKSETHTIAEYEQSDLPFKVIPDSHHLPTIYRSLERKS